jgi:hypothetical protein
MEDGNRWIELRNRTIYAGNDIILSPKGNDLRASALLTLSPNQLVFPDVLISTPTKSIRVVVLGKVYRENEPANERIGAYFDVDLGNILNVPPCNPKTSEGSIRAFTSMDLLIDLLDMPEGWQKVGGPVDITEKIHTELLNVTENPQAYMVEASKITFVADEEYAPSNTAGFRVSRYWNPDCATFFYKIKFPEGFDDAPPEWEDPNISANQSQFFCTIIPDPRECFWAAQYEEYIALFSTYLIPGTMTFDDIADIVRTINAQMVEYLYQREPRALNKLRTYP